MTKNYDRQRTQELEAPTDAEAILTRMTLCLQACDGIDEVLLKKLAEKRSDGQTHMQHLMRKVTYTGRHTRNKTK